MKTAATAKNAELTKKAVKPEETLTPKTKERHCALQKEKKTVEPAHKLNKIYKITGMNAPNNSPNNNIKTIKIGS